MNAIKVPDLFGRRMTHFSPDGNHLDKLEQLFCDYAKTGNGRKASFIYILKKKQHRILDLKRGEYTEWEPIPKG